jgi:hypothetical protein
MREYLKKLVGTSYDRNEFTVKIMKVGKKSTLVECVNTIIGKGKIPQEMKVPNDVMYNEMIKI